MTPSTIPLTPKELNLGSSQTFVEEKMSCSPTISSKSYPIYIHYTKTGSFHQPK
jgi:hypothetical protein